MHDNDLYLVHAFGEPVSDWLDMSHYAQPNDTSNAKHERITSAIVYANQRRAPTLSEYDRDAN